MEACMFGSVFRMMFIQARARGAHHPKAPKDQEKPAFKAPLVGKSRY